MHNEPREKLCELIAEYGRGLCDDPRRCGALLKDYCGQYKREIFVLVNALENRVAQELINVSAGVPVAILLSHLIKRLEDELGLAETAAKWAVESWALALGVINQPIPVSVSVSPKPVSPISQAPSTPAIVASPTLSTGGRLLFPKFSVGKVKIGSKEQMVVGEIDVPKGQTVELKVSEDVTDFSFLESCDPDGVINLLSMSGCGNFRDEQMGHLKNLANLQSVNLSGLGLCGFSSLHQKYWEHLKNLKHLQSIDLSCCFSLQGDALQSISEIKNLQSLNLNMTPARYRYGNEHITDKEIKYLGKLTNLTNLYLSHLNKVTDSGVLNALRNMTQLESLNLIGCLCVSAACIQNLKQLLPNTRITP